MFKKLSTRFIFVTLMVMLSSGLLSFIVSNVYYHSVLKAQNDTRITKVLLKEKHFIESHQEIKAKDFFEQLSIQNFQVFAVQQEAKMYGTHFRINNLNISKAKDVIYKNGVYHGIKDRPFNVFITGFFDNETRNTVGTKMHINGTDYYVFLRPDVGNSMHEFRIFLAILITIMLFISVIFVFISSKYIVLPVVKLKEAAKQIGEGNYLKTSIERQDEIGTLAREMDVMSEKIKAHEAMNKRFVANVSHEIQSPITNLLGELDQLEQTQDMSRIQSIKHQSKRLSGLTKQLLLLASIEQQEQSIQFETVALKPLIKEVIQSQAYSLDQKEIFVITKLQDVKMNGNYDLLFQMLSNLVSNAIKYNRVEGEIHIELANDKLIISDTGYGMDEQTKQHIFERFYKANVSEDEVSSNGLGMAIVKEIADIHQMDIHVESELGKGTTITIQKNSIS